MSAPYVRTSFDPEHPESATFERLEAGALGIAAGVSLPTTIGGSVASGERKAVLAHFHTLTDCVRTLYASKATAPSADSRALLDRYWLEFDRLAVLALRPAYHALNPHFFEWLESIAKPPPLARSGGVYACDSGNGDFCIVKVLVVEGAAVHARMYKDRFAVRPVTVDLETLTVTSRHVPLSIEGFDRWRPILLRREPVSETELDGYRLWHSRAHLS